MPRAGHGPEAYSPPAPGGDDQKYHAYCGRFGTDIVANQIMKTQVAVEETAAATEAAAVPTVDDARFESLSPLELQQILAVPPISS